MRIALISHSNAPWAPYYTRFLGARGHEVHLISFHPTPVEGAIFHYVGAIPPDGRLPKWIYLARAWRVGRILRRIRPDIVLATYYRSNGLVGALTKCAPLIVSSRGVDSEFSLPFGLGPRVTRWVASRADFLHASSQELAEILGHLGVPEERVAVIPLGTDANVFTPRSGPRAPGPARIICTRKHEPLYDNETIVRALARLRDRGLAFRARFVGSGSTIEESKRAVTTLGLEQQVEFLGDLEHREIPENLRWADVYVSAAASDGAPSSLFEAMSCRLYPVVTDVRANQDWITHRDNGFLFPVGDDVACADGLEFACRNLDGIAVATDRNRRTVAECLDRDRNLARLEALLIHVARQAEAAPS